MTDHLTTQISTAVPAEVQSARSRYSPQQTIHWLSHLAQQMRQQNQTVFYIERMQPTWLLKKGQRRLYYGLIAGPICGLFVGLQTLGTILSFPLTVLITALIVGLLFGWLSEPGTEKKNTKAITQTWTHIRQSLATALENRSKIGIAAGLFIGTSSLLYLYLGDFDNWPLGSRIAGALAGGLPVGGRIWVESPGHPGEGSRFCFTLPPFSSPSGVGINEWHLIPSCEQKENPHS